MDVLKVNYTLWFVLLHNSHMVSRDDWRDMFVRQWVCCEHDCSYTEMIHRLVHAILVLDCKVCEEKCVGCFQ